MFINKVYVVQKFPSFVQNFACSTSTITKLQKSEKLLKFNRPLPSVVSRNFKVNI